MNPTLVRGSGIRMLPAIGAWVISPPEPHDHDRAAIAAIGARHRAQT